MPFELDHLFICTEVGAPAAKQLTQFGLREGSANVHPGQGTANRRFFCQNLMLELLWVHNAAEAQAEATRPTHLWERWSGRAQAACPFGLCLRPSPGKEPDGLPFPAWDYRPTYLPEGLSIPVATNAAVLSEPMLFYLSFARRQDTYTGAKAEPLDHVLNQDRPSEPIALRQVTRVTLTLPSSGPLSEALQAVVDANLIEIRAGQGYLMELGFDGETRSQHQSFHPTLPLVIYW
ncbi:hypothetical protein [Nodosilinea nodulosa]|uniref:hypothetical protein n=1 Tax=Nodosilinea nodulosa TaxID=416001 RepID=UPI0003176B26|nr:hypothetical protein [Nodosilinea nodulosa]